MAWNTPITWSGTADENDFNDQLSENMNELRGGGIAVSSQAAGDILIASSATQWARDADLSYSGGVHSAELFLSTVDADASFVAGDIARDTVVLAWCHVSAAGALGAHMNVSTAVQSSTDLVTITFDDDLPASWIGIAQSKETATDSAVSGIYNYAPGSCVVRTISGRNPGFIAFCFVAIGGH